MATFSQRIKVLLVFLLILQSVESTSTTTLGSHKRSPNAIGDHEKDNEFRDQEAAIDHPNLKRSSLLEQRPLPNIKRELSDEADDGGGDVQLDRSENDRIENGVNTHKVNNEGDGRDRMESSAVQFDSGDEKQRRDLMSKITKLLQRHRELTITRESLRDLDLTVSNSYHEVLRRRNALSQAWENAHRARLRAERDLDFFQKHSVLQDETLKQLESQTNIAASLMEKLKKKYIHVLQGKAQLAEDFREHGLEHWVQNSVKGSVNPVVLDAIMQGTGYVVEPMLDGIEKLATMNSEVASAVSRGLNRQSSLGSYPFYSGFVSYTVLLCPLVIVISLLTRIKKGISRLSRINWITLGTFYFFMMTCGCLVATMLGSVDVLQTFRLHNIHLFNSLLVIHGLMYLFYILLHFYNVVRVPRQEAVSHFLVVTTVGVHFLIRLRKQSLSAEGLVVDVWAYFVYNAVFCFVLYETVFRKEGSSLPKKMIEAQEDTADDLKKLSSASMRSAVHASGD